MSKIRIASQGSRTEFTARACDMETGSDWTIGYFFTPNWNGGDKRGSFVVDRSKKSHENFFADSFGLIIFLSIRNCKY